ncbi:TPA: hypothetical protein NPP60_005060 [Klebsiella variicola subsp. variicola]|nr:hypothetical protein [Klebsiella variicola subsp. variicola]
MKHFKPLALIALCLLAGCDEPAPVQVETEQFDSATLERSTVTGEQLAELVTERLKGQEPADKEELQHLVSATLGSIATDLRATEGAFNDAVDLLIDRYQLEDKSKP